MRHNLSSLCATKRHHALKPNALNVWIVLRAILSLDNDITKYTGTVREVQISEREVPCEFYRNMATGECQDIVVGQLRVNTINENGLPSPQRANSFFGTHNTIFSTSVLLPIILRYKSKALRPKQLCCNLHILESPIPPLARLLKSVQR